MIRYTLVKDDLIYQKNSRIFIKEIFEKTDLDIKLSIENFNSLYKWDKMFNIKESDNRLKVGHRIFLFYLDNLVVGHCWINPLLLLKPNIYVYNVFVDKTKHSKDVCDSASYFSNLSLILFSEGYETIHADVEGWHNKSQSFFNRIGFKKELT